MTWSHARGHGRAAGVPGRRTADKESLTLAGRAGFVARGVVYALIGVLAVQIAFGEGEESADRQGALGQIAAQPFGSVVLWALAAGFGCMTVWRGAGAILARGAERKVPARLLNGGRAVFYAAVCWATAAYAAGSGGGGSGNAQPQDWTAAALKLPYGRVLVALAGAVLIGVGVVLAVRAAMRRFLRKLDSGAMSPRTWQAITGMGMGGGVARGLVFAAAGCFVLIAALTFDPHRAKGLDATLRSFTQTPAGPWLLVAVAVGLVLFGGFSFASARWRRL